MASTLPLPVPPRTPTPPADDDAHQNATQSKQGVSVDRDALSPLREPFPKSASMEPNGYDRLSPTKKSFTLSPGIAESPTKNASINSTSAGPFNFDTTVMAKSPVMKSVSLETMLPRGVNNNADLEHWTAPWPQVQAQQYLSPDFPRTASSRSIGFAQFPSHPNSERIP